MGKDTYNYVKMQFRIELYTSVLNSVHTDYKRVIVFINVIYDISLPSEGSNQPQFCCLLISCS